jgi:ABC-type multidrug transport system fused ATPase/permease subunit
MPQSCNGLTVPKTCLAFHAAALLVEPLPVNRYHIGLYGCVASLVSLAVPLAQYFIVQGSGRRYGHGLQSVYTSSFLGLLVTAFVLAGVYVSIPRRPDVNRDGKPVDRQYAVSLLHRISFAWADKLLDYAVRNRGLEIDDLHLVDSATMSINLRASLERNKENRPLWRAILATYWRALVWQYILVIATSLMHFAPQAILYGILKSLEDRESGHEVRWEAWAWALSLGVLTLLSATTHSWLWWIVITKMGIPIKEQLAATIFAKAMRRKDVRATENTKDDSEDSEDSSVTDNSENSDDGDDDDNDSLGKSQQSIINLVAVDAECVSDAAQYNHLLPSALFELTIACAFLVKLLGWQPTLAGLSISIIVLPVNIYTAKKYSMAQTVLMKTRDRKVAVLNEVLQGIRQIKFSALEGPWQKRVLEARDSELAAQWKALVYDICLLTIWLIGPIMLSAVSLAVYSTKNGNLSASVAFTAISIFGSLEVSFAVIPELVSDFIQASVSMARIDRHLMAPEKTQLIVPSDRVAFEKASIAWPVDNENTPIEERFVLQNLTFNIPDKGLTVVSGKTGSGKSLLLAAILGEADILNGVIKVPQFPPGDGLYDDRPNHESWLIDSAIAFVAQKPWIENASIRDNIIFGLPFDSSRYEKVIFACALKKDLDMLTDGDLTDIGTNGINLSGGQKWRVSFARALYSRASILVLDDIFSAVDAHTGRHLYENALIGELCHNRTRILVTHHVALCLRQADLCVFLENGTARSGTVEELRNEPIFLSILSEDKDESPGVYESSSKDNRQDSSDTVGPRDTSLTTLPKVAEVDKPENGARILPKKFMEDEGRETGSIKMAVYAKYFASGASLKHWFFGFFIAVVYVLLLIGRVSRYVLPFALDPEAFNLANAKASPTHGIDANRDLVLVG